MRGLKITFVLTVLVALARYVPVYYHSSEFKEYVRQETRHAQAKGQLMHALVTKAGDYRLPVHEEDINISTRDSVFRVAVDYRVPVNLYLFQHELEFRAVASRPAFGD